MKFTHLFITNLTFLLSLLFISGCGPRKSGVEQAAEAGILLLGNHAEPQSLDPQVATGVPENHVITSIMEGLIAYHPSDDTAIEPGLAERF